MLNRRILRIKVFKELFAVEMLPQSSLSQVTKELDEAMESTRDLYLFMMATIVELAKTAKARFAQLSMKVNKTEEELHPNRKFADNALSEMLANDPDLTKILKKKGLDWGAYDLILKKIYASIQTKAYFAEYMASANNSIAEDCRLFTHIFEEEFVDREDLEKALEDLSIYWNDDLAYSLTCCCHSLDRLARGARWALPSLYLSDKSVGMEDDEKFVHKLMQEAYLHYPQYLESVTAAVPNWDRDRLVGTDIAIIVTALAEIVFFPTIPVNVSINEYVEISKYYGTPKSNTFVNGILDTLSKKVEFKKQLQ